MAKSIQFVGGAGSVTGSKYLIHTKNRKFLVDCGLFQGLKVLRERNWRPLPFDPRGLDSVILTHAHLDHSGYIPVLTKRGFRGDILSTRATKALCGILLPDSGNLQEEDAHYANKHKYSRHSPALPLYTERDARKSLRFFRTVDYRERFHVARNIEGEFFRAGHIPGSAMLRLNLNGTLVAFSGDLGRPVNNLLRPPESMDQADVLVLESTYGDRTHDPRGPLDVLAELVNGPLKNKGRVLIPAFAVGRAQEILHYLIELEKQGRIPRVPLILDSPMAAEATDVFLSFGEELVITKEQMHDLRTRSHVVRTSDESRALNDRTDPAVIVSASGMATGGRVLHHIAHMAGNPQNLILFAGFQAPGTRGADMIGGKQDIKIHGEYVNIRCRVEALDVLSAHADANELIEWVRKFKRPPRHILVTHGEPIASEVLRKRLEKELGISASVPDYMEVVSLDSF
jgi:metallo-beta-lactamase family protein